MYDRIAVIANGLSDLFDWLCRMFDDVCRKCRLNNRIIGGASADACEIYKVMFSELFRCLVEYVECVKSLMK